MRSSRRQYADSDAVLQSGEEVLDKRAKRDEQGSTEGERKKGGWSPAPVVYGKVNRKLSQKKKKKKRVSVHFQKAAAELQATA